MDRFAVLSRARAGGVAMLVLPAVQASQFDAVRSLAHSQGLAYALGIHPLYVGSAADEDLDRLADALSRYADDPRLVATVGDTGLCRAVACIRRRACTATLADNES